MNFRLKERFGKKFDEEIRFFKGWRSNMKAVGRSCRHPVSPPGEWQASSIRIQAFPFLSSDPAPASSPRRSCRRVFSRKTWVSVEFSTDFYQHLVKTYPDVEFINGDAFDLDKTLGMRRDQQFDSVVSAVPLLNFPMHMRVSLIDDLLSRIPVGRPVIQISYGPLSPVVAMPDRYQISHYDFVVRNIPPAQLWVYRKTH